MVLVLLIGTVIGSIGASVALVGEIKARRRNGVTLVIGSRRSAT